MPAHAAARRSRLFYLASLAVIGTVAAVLMNDLTSSTSTSGTGSGPTIPPATSPTQSSASPSSAQAASTHASSPDSSVATHKTAATSPTSPSSSLAALIAQAHSGGASVSAYNTVTEKTVTMGATHGMLLASVSKLELLETLLLEHQESNTPLSSNEASEVHEMIEHSSNDAADDTLEAEGGRSAYVAHEGPLGMSTSITVAGPSYYWGLGTSSASQQVILLHNLDDADSPLNAASRAYALELLENVEDDQRWGVPSAADAHTTYAVKNGWLGVDADDGLWAVNSDGIITVDGQKLLVSVMTQHDSDFDDGIAYNEKLVHAVVAAVT